ncbi:MAG: hypothetical protein M1416_00625 [Candidatus Pacearchaeota archaeon]|nr:hypothetical protein [Candidatus Pacearchaeota archaeon]
MNNDFGILGEKDLMTLRWNADVHTVYRKTGEYMIYNNKGICLGEIRRGKIMLYDLEGELSKETAKIRDVSEKIFKKQLTSPEFKSKIVSVSPYLIHYQRDFLRKAS